MHCTDRRIFVQNLPRWRPAAILDLIETEIIAPFDTLTKKTPPITELEVDRMTRCGDIAI